MEIIIHDHRQNREPNTPPFEGAYRKSFEAHQVLKFKTHFVKEMFLKSEPDWFNSGKNHVESWLELSRDVECTEWFINIDAPEDLFNFIEAGQCGDKDYELYVTRYIVDQTIPALVLYSNFVNKL